MGTPLVSMCIDVRIAVVATNVPAPTLRGLDKQCSPKTCHGAFSLVRLSEIARSAPRLRFKLYCDGRAGWCERVWYRASVSRLGLASWVGLGGKPTKSIRLQKGNMREVMRVIGEEVWNSIYGAKEKL